MDSCICFTWGCIYSTQFNIQTGGNAQGSLTPHSHRCITLLTFDCPPGFRYVFVPFPWECPRTTPIHVIAGLCCIRRNVQSCHQHYHIAIYQGFTTWDTCSLECSPSSKRLINYMDCWRRFGVLSRYSAYFTDRKTAYTSTNFLYP